ncbi:MAG: ubiquinol-cytochrome C reductase, partial [Dietzia sp.]|nr:ubiquinol-cytochrome C reductase [Dietzia sp.]
MSSEQPGTDVAARTDAPDRFENPGLPAHRHRLADTDPRAAKRAERQVALLFGLSALGSILLIVTYFAVPLDGTFATLFKSNLGLGLGLGLAMFGIGVGAIHWAKTLMPDTERIEMRHPMRGSDEDREAAAEILALGAQESGLGRRALLRNS